MNKQIEVKILGQPYSLVAKEAEREQLLAAVAKVDQTMQQISSSGKLRQREKIAVLAAVQIAFAAEVNAQQLALAQPPQQQPAAPPAQVATAEPVDSFKQRQLELRLEALDILLEEVLRKNSFDPVE